MNLVLSEISSEAEDISSATRSEEEKTFTTENPNEEIRSSTTERPGASGWDEKIQVRESTELTTQNKSGYQRYYYKSMRIITNSGRRSCASNREKPGYK